LIALAPSAGAAVGGVTGISDRQEASACTYARAHASGAKLRGYVDGCSAASHVELAADAASTPFTYENPVYGSSFPDPGSLADGPTDYYAYATGGRFPIIKSPDLVHWEVVGHAFSARPSWVVQTGDWHPWAPSVLRTAGACPGTVSPACYFMYYVGLSGQHTPATHCIGVAWSLTPSGPFTDLGPLQAEDGGTDLAGRPPGCGDAAGYSNIDAAPFVDGDGTVYLYVSTGRRCATPTTDPCPYRPAISALPLTSTPTKVASGRVQLLEGTAGSWEQEPGAAAAVVENPWMEKRGDIYYLFYSGGSYLASYGMGYATSESPTEGFAKSALNPILAETADVLSPGGGSVTAGPGGESWLVYHGREGDYTQPRTMRIDPVYWSGTSVSTPGPTTGLQTFPPEEPPAPPDDAGGTPPPAGGGGDSPPPGGGTTPAPAADPSAGSAEATPPDLVPPRVRLAGKRVQRTRRGPLIKVTAATEDAWVTITARLRPGGGQAAIRLRRGVTRLIPGQSSATMRLTGSRRARRAIARAFRRDRRVVVTIRAAGRDGAGNAATARLTVQLVAAP